jgi:hypothetical protein
MSNNCNIYAQSCEYSCCDYNGFCTTSSSNCYYYYNGNVSAVLSIGAIIGIVIGCLAFVGAIIGFSCWLIRRRRLNMPFKTGGGGMTVVMTGGLNQTEMSGYPPNYGQAYNQQQNYGQTAYNPMMQQPPLGQPIMQ